MCLALILGGPVQSEAYSLKRTVKGARVRWQEDSKIILVGLEPSGDAASDLLLEEATRLALDAWNGQADFALMLAGPDDEPPWVTVGWAGGRWPYDPRWLGATESRFDEVSGALVQARVRINDVHHGWALEFPPLPAGLRALRVPRFDLAGTVTHELGHALGLEHSDVEAATMSVDTAPEDTSRRSLEPDDLAAVLDLYGPPSASVLVPAHGCSDVRMRRRADALAFFGVLLLLALRRPARSPS